MNDLGALKDALENLSTKGAHQGFFQVFCLKLQKSLNFLVQRVLNTINKSKNHDGERKLSPTEYVIK